MTRVQYVTDAAPSWSTRLEKFEGTYGLKSSIEHIHMEGCWPKFSMALLLFL